MRALLLVIPFVAAALAIALVMLVARWMIWRRR